MLTAGAILVNISKYCFKKKQFLLRRYRDDGHDKCGSGTRTKHVRCKVPPCAVNIRLIQWRLQFDWAFLDDAERPAALLTPASCLIDKSFKDMSR